MNKELVKLANHLDRIGHRDLADRIDKILKSANWAGYIMQQWDRVSGGTTDAKEGVKQWADGKVEELKNLAYQGSAAARRELEDLTEEPAAIASGIAQAATDALAALQSGYQAGQAKEMAKQKAETAEWAGKATGYGEAASKAGESAGKGRQRAGRGASEVAGGVTSMPGAAKKDWEEGSESVGNWAREVAKDIPKLEAPPGPPGTEQPAVAKSAATWAHVQAKLNALNHTDSTGNKLATDNNFGTKSKQAWDRAGKGSLPKTPAEALAALEDSTASDGLFGEARRKQDRINKLAELMSGEFTVNTPGSFRR